MQMHRFLQKVSQALRERLLVPLRLLTLGEVLIAASIGLLGGVFPVPLVTAMVTLLVGFYIQCTSPQLILGSTTNFFCTPLQFALIPRFARLVGLFIETDVSDFTGYALQRSLNDGYTALVYSCGRMLLYATMGWFIVAVPATVVLNFAQKCVVHYNMQKSDCNVN
ncbi:hypothetical protein JKF63_04048 [Porcisia hertigi]|uniref:DUF2062 domain-containing protein n=1 Tax=Porcisia hertigi TaxID=2761500 RepID=A0A836HYY0_9TRYP|nr:hypothetical protein JKF63_04048 [Porcisia hertigi]